tara:strand:- start:2133 stop:2513 length:381 start_codon:yes stop_codon:yes gene_type:complete
MNLEFTIYQTSTGKIAKAIQCDEETLKINLGDGESYIEGFYRPSDYEIVEGEPVQIVIDQDQQSRNLNLTRRNMELAGTDWTQLSDVALTDSEKAKYATYRQALRDITTHSNWPNLNDSDWPTMET